MWSKEIFKFRMMSLLIVLLVSIGTFAAPNLNHLPAGMEKLPLGVQLWFLYETDYLSRKVDNSKISSPVQNAQDRFYAPESKNVFTLTGLWIPESELNLFKSEIPKNLQKVFMRKRGGVKQFLFFVHPESMDLYSDLLAKNYEREEYNAIATASSRSLLVWKDGQEDKPFIAKVSLNKKIGGITRTILDTESEHVTLLSETLRHTNLGDRFLYLDEVLSVLPKGLENAGMIVRPLPLTFASGERFTYAPLFALYGGSKN
ncbi:MAG TPA: hypothetical protein VN132_00195, partial [Bdellovibrio sp.]|nr:hypothetical protein [Bdellovibrio sp.]